MSVRSLGRGNEERDGYVHADWETRRRFCRFLLRTIAFTVLVKVDEVAGLENIPQEGPAVLLMNHIAFVDPILLVHVVPRHIVPLAKVEVYRYPGVGIFPRLWGVIPVKREGVDRKAVQLALDVLGAGEIILVAPEGTRNRQLQRGKEGVSYLASRAGAPVVPVAIEGTPGFPSLPFLPRWQQPGAHVRFGRPFRFRPELRRAARDELRRMADEAMFILSAMLPEHRRGVYTDQARATQETIEWL